MKYSCEKAQNKSRKTYSIKLSEKRSKKVEIRRLLRRISLLNAAF